ncbi:MAG TPA: GNAT family N-acetyltransferase [Clostridiales bacterium]|nr:GNAT family N-acetyltransferase [Clostridiales bacterium]
MNMKFVQIKSHDEIKQLAVIAHDIWFEFFPCILSTPQIAYMVEKFQSSRAIANQINVDGYSYYTAVLKGEIIGFVGIKPEADSLFLSKLYLKKAYRSKGYGSKMLDFVEKTATSIGLNRIYLRVNKYNENSINVYKYRGFTIVDEQKADIGNGYYMDDFVMEKIL